MRTLIPVLAVSLLIGSTVLPAHAQVSISGPFNFREHVGPNAVGSPPGDHLTIGQSALIGVTISDIKPDSFPNSINLGSHGKVPVAILSAAGFDATSVDATTVSLAGAPVARTPRGRLMATVEDVNGDGLPDLVLHFPTWALSLGEDATEAVLEGQTANGKRVRGVDSVKIVP